MGKVLKIPQRVEIGSVIGQCEACQAEVFVVDYGSEDPHVDEWLGSCCECARLTYWFLNEGQWDYVTTDEELEESFAPVVELFPKGA